MTVAEAALVATLLLRGFGQTVIVSQQDESRQELESSRVAPHEPVSVETIDVATTRSILSVFLSFSHQIMLI